MIFLKSGIKIESFYDGIGASGRTRTDTLLRAADFESATSTNFVTLAKYSI